MQVNYFGLWKKRKDKRIKNKTDLIPLANILTKIFAKTNKCNFVSMSNLKKIYVALECDISDICIINQKIDIKFY